MNLEFHRSQPFGFGGIEHDNLDGMSAPNDSATQCQHRWSDTSDAGLERRNDLEDFHRSDLLSPLPGLLFGVDGSGGSAALYRPANS